MIENTRSLLQFAYEHYAIGAYSVNTMEQILGAFAGANAANAPLIIQISHKARQYAGPNTLETVTHEVARRYPDLIFGLHLDHGNEEDCHACIDSGFYASVMIDASDRKFEENVDTTKRVVDHAHQHGISVEAELGRLSGKEDDIAVAESDAFLTDPDQAALFVELTGCEALAVAVGTSHGVNKFAGTGRIHMDRLLQIQQRLPGIPLVLHGASSVPIKEVERINAAGGTVDSKAQGVSSSQYRQAIRHGVCKINIDTDSRLLWMRIYREQLQDHPENLDLRMPGQIFIDEYSKLVARHSQTFGCAGQQNRIWAAIGHNQSEHHSQEEKQE